MKPNLKWMPVLLPLTCLSLNAFAEGGSGSVGNGGGAHVCYRDAAKTSVVSAELYDLWEGREAPTGAHLNIPKWDGHETKVDVIERILAKISVKQSGLAREMRKALRFMVQPDVLVDASGVDLIPSPDARLLYVARNCEYVQVVNWQEENTRPGQSTAKVLRNESFYTQVLNPLNQAALDLHEAAYRVYRNYRPYDYEKYGSIETRQFIAQAFSNEDVKLQLVSAKSLNYGLHRITRDNLGEVIYNLVGEIEACKADPVRVTRRYVSGTRKKITWLGPETDYDRGYEDHHGKLKVGESRTDKVSPTTDIAEFGLFAIGGPKTSAQVEFVVEGCGIGRTPLTYKLDYAHLQSHTMTLRIMRVSAE